MSEHRRVTRQLEKQLAGELPPERSAEVERHLERCDDCQGWSETYGFLTDALRGDEQAEHPAGEQLAQLAVDPDLLTAPERRRLAAHVEDCARCRRELELCRQALAESRRPARQPRFPAPSRRAAVRVALAAGLIVAAGATFVGLRPDEAEPARAAATRNGAAPGVIGDGGRRMSGERLQGKRLLESPETLSAGSVAIQSGSEITLRAGEMVVLDNGFSIGSTATLGVENVPRPSSDGDSESS